MRRELIADPIIDGERMRSAPRHEIANLTGCGAQRPGESFRRIVVIQLDDGSVVKLEREHVDGIVECLRSGEEGCERVANGEPLADGDANALH